MLRGLTAQGRVVEAREAGMELDDAVKRLRARQHGTRTYVSEAGAREAAPPPRPVLRTG